MAFDDPNAPNPARRPGPRHGIPLCESLAQPSDSNAPPRPARPTPSVGGVYSYRGSPSALFVVREVDEDAEYVTYTTQFGSMVSSRSIQEFLSYTPEGDELFSLVEGVTRCYPFSERLVQAPEQELDPHTRPTPRKGEVYRHHREPVRNHYVIEAVGRDTAAAIEYVSYTSLADGHSWVRPLREFLGLTAEGKARFTLVSDTCPASLLAKTDEGVIDMTKVAEHLTPGQLIIEQQFHALAQGLNTLTQAVLGLCNREKK